VYAPELLLRVERGEHDVADPEEAMADGRRSRLRACRLAQCQRGCQPGQCGRRGKRCRNLASTLIRRPSLSGGRKRNR